MNSKMLFALGAAALVGVGGFIFFSSQSQNTPNEQAGMEDTMQQETNIEEDETVMIDESNNMINDDAMTAEEEGMMEDDDAMTPEEEANLESDGTEAYQEYSAAAFNATSDKKRVYFFHASWCPTCRTVDKEITSNSEQIPEDVVVFKTDYDTETDLKNRYGVTYQHTFVYVDENGEEVKTWNGGSVEEIVENTQM